MSSIRNRFFPRKKQEPPMITITHDQGISSIARVNSVYYPNWRVYRQQPPSSLNLDFVTHILYAFAWLKPDGTVYSSDEYADKQINIDGVRGALADLKCVKAQRPQIKILLSIGGGGKGSDNFPDVARNPRHLSQLSSTAKSFVEAYDLDGIDVNREHPSNPAQGRDYVNLLSTLRTALPSQRYVLTSALPCGEYNLANINIGQATHFLDYINLMCYDFSGPWTTFCGHQAQLHSPKKPYDDASKISCESAVGYLLSHGVPASKVLIGIPAYGRSFLRAKKAGDPYNGSAGEEGTFEYRDLPRPESKVRFDEECGATHCVGGDAGFVSYDDQKSVQMKAGFVKQKGLGGLFYWTGTADTNDGRSLVATGWQALK